MFPFLSSKIVLVQALISTELLCCVFYLIQWLFADFIITSRARENMKELSDLLLASTLLLFIVSCHFPYTEPLVRIASSAATRTVQYLRCEAIHVYKFCAAEIAGVGKHGLIAQLERRL
jgi:hypothetical protein